MRNFSVSPVLVSGVLDRKATLAALEVLMDERVAADTADLDLVGPVAESLFDSMPECSAFPSSTLIEACAEEAFEAHAAKNNGTKPTTAERVAIRARLASAVPEYVKSNADYLHLSKRAGIRVRSSLSEANANKAPRISDEEWSKITTVKEKAPKTETV